MNSNRQLINLAGLLIVIAILVAGVALVALPMWAQSRTIDENTMTVEQTNAVYEAQIAQLSAAGENIEEVDVDLAELRTAIPAATSLDDVFEIISAAAERTEVVVNLIKVGDAEKWMPRAGAADEGETQTPAEATTEDAEEATPAPNTEPVASASETAPDAAVGPQQQLTVTIEVAAPDARTAMAFVDALGRGPRLLAPIDATLDDGTLTVTVLTFMRTED